MKPNPGGQLSPENIIGRDQMVEGMWQTLEGRSIYMNDLRRIGKTMILRKMDAKPPSGWLTVKRDLGGYHTAAEFATGAFRDSAALLGKKTRALRKMENLIGKLQGIEIAGIVKLPDGTAAPWKEVLTRTFADLEEELTAIDHHVVFLWDEVPFLLANVAKREGPHVAMEILDALRSLSQDYSRVRFVLTGSVGLHHVLADLRGKGYLGSPLNHMEFIAPGALASKDAQKLAEDLLQGSGLKCSRPKVCAKAVATSVGNVAFYVHKLISRMSKGTPVTPASIQETLRKEITRSNNDWDLTHYRTRLPLYYGLDEKVVLVMLDTIAASETPVSLAEIRKAVSAQMNVDDKEQLLRLLKLLQEDHYLERDDTGTYSFRFALIRQWWCFDRNLEAKS